MTRTDPEMAHVGLGESRFRRLGRRQHPGADSALSEMTAPSPSAAEGMVKVVTHRNGRILGATILALQAGEMILAWSLAIASRRKIASMAGTIAPIRPSATPALAAGQFFTEALFSPRTRRIVRLLLVVTTRLPSARSRVRQCVDGNAAIAPAVERTLGKGEVACSITLAAPSTPILQSALKAVLFRILLFAMRPSSHGVARIHKYTIISPVNFTEHTCTLICFKLPAPRATVCHHARLGDRPGRFIISSGRSECW